VQVQKCCVVFGVLWVGLFVGGNMCYVGSWIAVPMTYITILTCSSNTLTITFVARISPFPSPHTHTFLALRLPHQNCNPNKKNLRPLPLCTLSKSVFLSSALQFIALTNAAVCHSSSNPTTPIHSNQTPQIKTKKSTSS